MSNRGTSGRLASWFAALASALALPLLALALAVLALEPASALAATPPQVTLVDGEGGRTGEPVTKGGVSYTAWMSTPGMGGSAYCVNPGMDSPVGSSAATLACSPLRTENGAFGADDLAAFLWFSVDGPGYDSSMWPATDWEGNHLNDNQRYWLGHSIATYLYNGNVAAPQDSYASYINSWDKFRSWYPRIYRNVNAYEVSRINSLRDWMWAWVIDANNPNTTVAKMLARKNEVPDSFQTYTIPSS